MRERHGTGVRWHWRAVAQGRCRIEGMDRWHGMVAPPGVALVRSGSQRRWKTMPLAATRDRAHREVAGFGVKAPLERGKREG